LNYARSVFADSDKHAGPQAMGYRSKLRTHVGTQARPEA